MGACLGKKNQTTVHAAHQGGDVSVSQTVSTAQQAPPPAHQAPFQSQGAQQAPFQSQGITHNETTVVIFKQYLPAVGPAWLSDVVISDNPAMFGLDMTGAWIPPKMVVESCEYFYRNAKSTDKHTSDAVRITNPVNSGKHVFEIEWPKHLRGNNSFCSIGVGIKSTPVTLQGKKSLIGETSQSFGFDIARKRIVHHGSAKEPQKYPAFFNKDVPDMFYMFIDMDPISGGVLSFGSTHEYWGTAFEDMIRIFQGEDAHVMISTNVPMARARITYRGSYIHPSLKQAPALTHDQTVTANTMNSVNQQLAQIPASVPPPGPPPPGAVAAPPPMAQAYDPSQQYTQTIPYDTEPASQGYDPNHAGPTEEKIPPLDSSSEAQQTLDDADPVLGPAADQAAGPAVDQPPAEEHAQTHLTTTEKQEPTPAQT